MFYDQWPFCLVAMAKLKRGKFVRHQQGKNIKAPAGKENCKAPAGKEDAVAHQEGGGGRGEEDPFVLQQGKKALLPSAGKEDLSSLSLVWPCKET